MIRADNVNTFNKPTSGVCANGIISCKAGTWEDCVGYKWNADNDKLSLIETGIGALGGCYCINNSCGDAQRTSRIISTIVGDIGSSAANTITTANPKYTISNSKITGPLAKFYAQNIDGCGKGNINQLAGYKNNPAQIESEANTLKTDADGIYQLIQNSAAAKNNIVQTKTCEVKRNTSYQNIKLDDIITYNGGSGGMRRCTGKGCLELVLGNSSERIYGWCAIHQRKASFYVNMPERIKKATLINVVFDDWARVALNGSKIFAGPVSRGLGNWDGKTIVPGKSCEYSTVWRPRPNTDFTHLIKNKGKQDFTIDVQVADWGFAYAYAQVLVDESCKLDQEYISNQCESIQDDKKCTLKNEWIDSVQTYKNFHPTSKTPIATQKQIGSGSCDIKLKRNWWNIKREYQCQTNIEFNFDEALKRKNVIKNSTTSGSYNDLIDGTTTSRGIAIPDIKINTCTNACKTKRIKQTSTVTGAGAKINQDKSNTEFETLYRKCTGEKQNICPASQDETIIKSCGCLNEFGEVSSMMNSMRYAAQDLICTTGDPQTF